MPTLSATVDIWQHHASTARSTTVVPDGCCDLIWHALPGQCPEWFVTDLATQSYHVPGTVGESNFGFRLQPGTCINSSQLLAALANRPGDDANDILPILYDYSHLDAAVHEALLALADCESVERAARALGVAERTLQRLVGNATGQSPAYWKRLARMRRATRSLALAPCLAPSLADVAATWGYTDQAHMTREFQRWLGTTPAALRTQLGIQEALRATGYG